MVQDYSPIPERNRSWGALHVVAFDEVHADRQAKNRYSPHTKAIPPETNYPMMVFVIKLMIGSYKPCFFT
jgi:hypothetical protein